jgi:hypothetical protein
MRFRVAEKLLKVCQRVRVRRLMQRLGAASPKDEVAIV